MSRRYTDLVTLEIDGRERDVEIRGNVDTEMRGRGMVAELDGPVEVKAYGRWVDLDELSMPADSRERAFDALSEAALDDDSDQCIDGSSDDEEWFT